MIQTSSPIDDHSTHLKSNGWERGSTANRYRDLDSENYVDYMTHQSIAIGRKATLTFNANATAPSRSTVYRNKSKVFAKPGVGVVNIDAYIEWVNLNGYTSLTHISSDATAALSTMLGPTV
jgi:hypothetical protein